MSFDILEAVPSSAVATSGTITFAYPSGRSAGDYAGYGHKAVAVGLMNSLSVDAGDFSVTFGASDITFTYRGSTSIPANTKVRLQLDLRGAGQDQAPALVGTKRVAYSPIVRLDLGSPDTADADGIVESQNLTAAGAYSVLAFNGVYGDPYANAYAVLDVPRNVVAAWTGNAQMTVTGLDEYGDVLIEKSSAATTSLTGKKAFKKITSIAVDTNVTALTVGTGDVLGLPVFLEKAGYVLGEIEDGLLVGGPAAKIRLPFFGEQVSVLAGTTAAIELIAPCAGVITKMTVVTRAAVTTGGAVTAKVGTTDVVGLSVAVADGSVKGTTTSDTPTAGDATTVVAKDSRIQIVFADLFATAGACDGYIEIQPTDVASGKIVAGVQTLPTATTGDVRGTYDPESACDGTKSFSLIASVPDPTYKGVDNYDG